MADAYYDSRNRRRRRRDFGRQEDEHSSTPSKPQAPVVTILGLAKPSTSTQNKARYEESTSASGVDNSANDSSNSNINTTTTANEFPATNSSTNDKDKSTVVLLSSSENRPRAAINKTKNTEEGNESRSNLSSGSKEDSHLHSHESHNQSIVSKRSTASSGGNAISGIIDQGAHTQNKLAPPFEKQGKIKLIEDFQWCDTGLELMLDQTDFVVVGIVGLQGCGKSTLLSLLAGNTHQDAYRNYFFYPQTKETKEDCLFQTSGIDMYVTSERVILLDSQPLLSAAVMDCQLRYERKLPTEYSSLQNFIEMQSMQILTFLMSVCNIVLVADDHFVDINFLKFIRDAEMLKPSTQMPMSSDGSSVKDDGNDYYPTVIFIHNKASREDFKIPTYNLMQATLDKMFQTSKLKVRSNVNMYNSTHGEAIMSKPSGQMSNEKIMSVNLLMLPVMEFYKSEPEWLQTTIPEYRGYPSFNTLLNFYRAQVMSAQRTSLTPSTLSEKNWYHFAARMWETVKKSPLLAEYNRLLS